MNKPEEKMNELSLNEMEQVSGGKSRTVNTGISGVNAALRKGPSKGSRQLTSIPNGTTVNTLNENNLVWDDVARRYFVEIEFYDQNGGYHTGWVASSLVGLKR